MILRPTPRYVSLWKSSGHEGWTWRDLMARHPAQATGNQAKWPALGFPLRTSETPWRPPRRSTGPPAHGGPLASRMGKAKSNTLTLQPDEFPCFEPVLTSPPVSYGQSISVDLTVCIGEGEDELCRVLDVIFHASRSTVEPHQRTFPNTTVSTALMPAPCCGVVRWNSILPPFPAWSFEAEGASINSTTLELNGGSKHRGHLCLKVTMPANAPPQRHMWTLTSDDIVSGDVISVCTSSNATTRP